MNNTLKLILVSSMIIGFLGFLGGMEYGKSKGRQNLLESQQEMEQNAIEEQRKEDEYNSILEKVCSQIATESSVLDLHKCKILKEEKDFLPFFGLEEIEEELENRKNVVPCSRNISESKLGEIVDCLNFGESEFE